FCKGDSRARLRRSHRRSGSGDEVARNNSGLHSQAEGGGLQKHFGRQADRAEDERDRRDPAEGEPLKAAILSNRALALKSNRALALKSNRALALKSNRALALRSERRTVDLEKRKEPIMRKLITIGVLAILVYAVSGPLAFAQEPTKGDWTVKVK